MKSNENIERDLQLAALLQESFAPRSEADAEHFTHRVMHNLPQRRRKPLLAMLLAYIQSPFWLVTAVFLCLLLLALRADYLLECLDSLTTLFATIVLVSITTAFLAFDMLRDVDEMPSASF